MTPKVTLLALIFAAGCLGNKPGSDDDTASTSDNDGDGYSAADGDCDDGDGDVNPGATEICDGLDNNCDGNIDEGVLSDFYADNDSDGFGAGASTQACEAPAGTVPNGDDCDDGDNQVYPGATEICDGEDNDCDGDIDEDAGGSVQYRDRDGDGFGDPDDSVTGCAGGGDYVSVAGDCDDGNANINPDADEVCDGRDNDCDGDIDEADAIDATLLAEDADGDGFGARGTTDLRCDGVDNEADCDDSDSSEPHVVDATASGSQDGSAAHPWAKIQDGIDHASQCVVVEPGTYIENIDFGGRGVAVVSVGGAPATTIDGGGNGPAVTLNSGEGADSELSGFMLTGGSGYSETTTETVTDSSGNVDHYVYYITACGGGLFVDGATPTISNLILRDNLLTTPSDTTDSSGNEYLYFSYGGGACFRGTTMTAERVDVIGNDAEDGGGVFVDNNADLTLRKSIITANTADHGAGFEVDGGRLGLTNVALSWNTASVEGGGILVLDGGFSGSNITSGGDAAPKGGALYLATVSAGSVGRLGNSIIAQTGDGDGVLVDTSGTFDGQYNDVWGSADSDYSGVSDPTGGQGNISSNPKFTSVTDNGDWTDDDWTLQSSSPAVDAGNPDSAYNDADGSRADMGAFGGPESTWLH